MASTETAVARKLASHRQLNGFRPIPIDASVILLFLSDVEGGDQSPCAAMVRRAMEFKGRSINFFVTAYYADDNGDSRADRIGWQKSENDKSFRAMDTNYIEQYKKGLAVSSIVAQQQDSAAADCVCGSCTGPGPGPAAVVLHSPAARTRSQPLPCSTTAAGIPWKRVSIHTAT
jgi:hypothetical protein